MLNRRQFTFAGLLSGIATLVGCNRHRLTDRELMLSLLADRPDGEIHHLRGRRDSNGTQLIAGFKWRGKLYGTSGIVPADQDRTNQRESRRMAFSILDYRLNRQIDKLRKESA